MKKKILLALLALVIIIGVLLLTTKSNKQIFMSYIIRDDIWEVLKEKNVETYVKKQKETPYTNKGQISVTTDGLEEKTLGMMQNINCFFEGKTNKSENKLEQEITMNTENNSSIKFRQDNQKIGIQISMLGSKFVAVENDNLKQLAEKFGFKSEIIPNKIELGNAKIIESGSKLLKSKYLKILKKHLTNNQFSKEKAEGQTVMSLSITEQKMVEIMKDILQEIRDDKDIFNGISEEIKKQVQTEIDVIISDLDSLEINPNNKYIINLYVKSNDIKKYEIIFAEGDIEISKTTIENTDTQISITAYQDDNLLLEGSFSKRRERNDMTYDISIKAYIEGQKTEFILKWQYKNLLKLDDVEEILEIKVAYEDQNQYGNLDNTSNKMDINIDYSNKKTFTPKLEIEGINEDNAIILNTATNKDLQSIILSIYISLGLF